jgi:hypothetical protein
VAIITRVSAQPESEYSGPLPPEERAAIAHRLEAMKRLFAEESKFKAKYKIELLFGEERSIHRPVLGGVTFWEHGSQLGGGGDARLYLCPGKRLGRNGCTHPIPFDIASQGKLLCPKCRTLWQTPEECKAIIGEVLGRHTLQQWASVLLYYFRVLGQNCDFYVKYAVGDIRAQALLEQQRDRGGELLGKIRRRSTAAYPLYNIIKDMSAGADPYRRIFAFLTV